MSFLSVPLHPALVHLPIALLLLGAIAALAGEWLNYERIGQWGIISLLVGWVLTLPAIITGLIDKSELAPGSATDTLADQHTTANFVMWALFGLALYVYYRWRDSMHQSGRRWVWSVLLLAASLILLLASHLGGRLVYEMGVGVQLN